MSAQILYDDHMTAAQIHLVINHAPIFAVFFGLLLYMWSSLKNSSDIKSAALVLFVLAGLFSIITFITGEEAEDMIEQMQNVSHHVLESHEESAETANIITIVLAGFSLLTLVLKNKLDAFRKPLHMLTLVLAISSLGALGYAGFQGGKIIHKEIHGSTEEETDDFYDEDEDDDEYH